MYWLLGATTPKSSSFKVSLNDEVKKWKKQAKTLAWRRSDFISLRNVSEKMKSEMNVTDQILLRPILRQFTITGVAWVFWFWWCRGRKRRTAATTTSAKTLWRSSATSTKWTAETAPTSSKDLLAEIHQLRDQHQHYIIFDLETSNSGRK